MQLTTAETNSKLIGLLTEIYGSLALEQTPEVIAKQLWQGITSMGKISRQAENAADPDDGNGRSKATFSEADALLITYGDSVVMEGQKPLQTLQQFLASYCNGVVNAVHILPFFPYSSDDGFSVLDYSSVNEALGTWQDIRQIAKGYKTMADVVLNHCSARGIWFENFLRGEGRGANFFYTTDQNADLSAVIRPRSSDLLKPVYTAQGEQFVWCTFSHDQVDFDFRNPEVLIAFVDIIRQYLDQGIRIFRLDAVAFIWKKPGSCCLHLPQAHAIVRVLRLLIESVSPDALVITETNVPMAENLSYFGAGDEAHLVYNFCLPPLLLHTLISADSEALSHWQMNQPELPEGCCLLNFIASHDGIGLRPAEGLLTQSQLDAVISTTQVYGGKISWRKDDKGNPKAYELNISLRDALRGTARGSDVYGADRFICAHAIMFALAGIPAIYIHSLMGTTNDYKKVEHSGHNRCINRHRWNFTELEGLLSDPTSANTQIYRGLQHLLAVRKSHRAFHPNSPQRVISVNKSVFVVEREAIDKQTQGISQVELSKRVICISNVSDLYQTIDLKALSLAAGQLKRDLISGEKIIATAQNLELRPYQSLWLEVLTP